VSDLILLIRVGVRNQLREQHDMMRDIVQGLDGQSLNWPPGQQTNSIAQLLGHALEAERFLVATALDIAMKREREALFEIVVDGADDVIGLIDQQERELDSVLNHVTAEQLARNVTRTIAGGERTRSGFQWLLQAVAHSREHIGQASLTRQMYEQRQT
jgi:uncharacterized damage-inducible protein DinB